LEQLIRLFIGERLFYPQGTFEITNHLSDVMSGIVLVSLHRDPSPSIQRTKLGSEFNLNPFPKISHISGM
jgi:hypothetical protein